MSTVTGTAIAAFDALSDTVVTVTAKDAGGTDIGTGGDLFYVQITNRWTKTSNFECTVNGGADNTIVTAITALMTDNNDGTYTYILNHNNEGVLSISVILYNRFSVFGTWYDTVNLSGTVANTNISTSISYNWGAYNVTATKDENASGKMEGYLKSPYSGSVDLILYTDNLAGLWVDGVEEFDFMTVGCVWERSTTVTLVADQYYYIEAHFGEQTGGAFIEMRWNYPGITKEAIPSSAWFYPEYVANSPYNSTVSWPTGYIGTNSSVPNTCTEECGDGNEVGDEKCDDGNTSGTVDGCSADCRSVDAGYVCIGGGVGANDVCTFCNAGFYQDNATNPEVWVEQWGDGLEVGVEKCDDGNDFDGDGCANDCTTVEASWVCIGGSSIAPDVCSEWTSGWYQDSSTDPETWVEQWGDGFEVGVEKCDDANTSGTVDGCAADCLSVDAGWVCIGGNATTADVCIQWAPGFEQNSPTNPELCVTRWGDGLEAGLEKCDDSNFVASDGCAADCLSVEAGWVCIGGSTTTVDVCSLWADGYEQNDPTNPEVCVTRWGDGLEAGLEVCDDGNTASGDGCNSGCSAVEAGWVCIGGSPTRNDFWYICSSGWEQNSSTNPETCVEICGDGKRVGTEVCDDNNTVSGDGCNSLCTDVEDLYICTGGNLTITDDCKTCPANYEPNSDQSEWVPKSITNSAITFAIIYICFVFAAMILNFLTLITSRYYYQSLFSMINQVQLIILIPLIGEHVPAILIDFNRFLDWLMGSFALISKHFIPLILDPIEDYNYKHSNWYLYLIEIESGSSMFSITGLIFMVFLMSLVHALVYVLNDVSLEKKDDSKFGRSTYYLAQWMTVGSYIRLFLFSFTFLLLSSISEIQKTSNGSDHGTSYSFAVGILLFCLCATVAMTMYTMKYDDEEEETKWTKVTKELFNAIKPSKLARFYYPMFCIRRILFVLILLGYKDLDSTIKLSFFIIVQLAHVIYITAVRPFLRFKDNIGEIMNEVFYLCLVCFLIAKIGSDSWGSQENNLYMGAIMFNAVAFFVIAISKFVNFNII
jgi:cysteine-rich repeat protein